MELTSCLYDTEIMHHRLTPREHKFRYRFFSFCLDLDEIDAVTRMIPWISRNRFNLFSFYDKDHLVLGDGDVKENILAYLQGEGIDLRGGRIVLVTYLRVLGYVFNPVSFYFCYDVQNTPVCAVAEISNTFGEMKPFLLKQDTLRSNRFHDERTKHYYISPFTQLDDRLEFHLSLPGEILDIRINTRKQADRVILTSMTGTKQPLTAGAVLKYALMIPFETLQAIILIHWHALLLFFKKIPFERKESNPHLQRGVHQRWFSRPRQKRDPAHDPHA